MAKAAVTRRIRDDHQKNFLKIFNSLTGKHSRWEIWEDFVTLTAIEISNSTDKVNAPERTKMYQTIVSKYSAKERDGMVELLGEVIMGMEQNPDQDFLGSLYMMCELGNDHAGQFFTPYDVCRCMAEITFDPKLHPDMEGFISVSDPACGAGALLIAFANLCRRKNICYHDKVLFVAQDIDLIAGLMCYILIMAYNVEKLAKLGALKELGLKQKAVDEAQNKRIKTLEDVGAQANVLEGVKVNGVALAIAEKMVDILVATGSKNGSISVAGTDVAIKGLAALAYKAKISQSDLDDALAAVLAAKADKATTLGGYGITDAYTKDEINAKISAVYKPAGSVVFSALPALAENVLGNVYNVTDAFTTTNNFVEGAGNKYPKGTNVVVVKVGDAYKYDVLAGFVDLSGYVEKEAGKGLSDENFTAALKDKLDGIAAGANKYVHPTHTAAASGLYKTTVDEEGHVTATTPVTKDDITNLGIPAQDTTYGNASAAADGLMAAADKSKLDGMIIATDSEVSEMLAEVYGE